MSWLKLLIGHPKELQSWSFEHKTFLIVNLGHFSTVISIIYSFVLLSPLPPPPPTCKGQWRQLLPLCYLLFRSCQTCLLCSLSLKKTINIGSWTVSFMLTLLSYWNTQGVATFHRFHFKHNVPTNFLRKQSL